VLEPERNRLDEDVQGAGIGKRVGRHRLDFVHPGIGAIAGRDRVREQRGAGGLLRDCLTELARQPQRTQLSLAREPVTGLALEGRGAGREHLPREAARLRQHHLVSGLPQRSRGGGNPAARAGNLLVRHACHLLLIFVRAPAGEWEMGVAVDEPRE